MAQLRLTRKFRFEMAHALNGYDGPCRNIHGHSYEFMVTVSGKPIHDGSAAKNGMVLDFKQLKALVNRCVVDQFDHALVLSSVQPKDFLHSVMDSFDNVIVVDFQPTTENLLIEFAHRIEKELPQGVKLFSMRLKETENSFAEWFAEDN